MAVLFAALAVVQPGQGQAPISDPSPATQLTIHHPLVVAVTGAAAAAEAL